MKRFYVSALRVFFAAVLMAGGAAAGDARAQEVFSTSTAPETQSGAPSASGGKGNCAEAYSAAQKQIVAARIRVDADYKKEKIGCNGKSGCIRAAQKKYSEAQRDIQKQQVDASAENDICRTQTAAGSGTAAGAGAGPAPGAPGSPGNPLQGYVSNAPPPAGDGPHTPLYYLNNALNDAVSRVPGGEQGLQQAGQAAAQVDRTINQGLNDASKQSEAARQAAVDEFIRKWTHQMSPQEAVGEVAGAWAGNAAGAGIGAGAGSILKGGVAGGMTKAGVAKAGAAAVKAATEEAAVTAGAGSALGRGMSGNAPHGEAENTPAPAAAAIEEEVGQMSRAFAEDFEGAFGSNGAGDIDPNAIFAQNACFHEGLGQAQLWRTEENFIIKGVRNLGKPDLATSSTEIREVLKSRFGGQGAADNPAFTAAEKLAQQQGIPVRATPSRIEAIIDGGRNGDQWLIFAKPAGEMGHIFNGRFVNNAGQLYDVSNQMNGRLWLSMKEYKFFIYQLY